MGPLIKKIICSNVSIFFPLTILHAEWPKLQRVLAILSPFRSQAKMNIAFPESVPIHPTAKKQGPVVQSIVSLSVL